MSAKRYILTAAQNNTPVHPTLWRNVRAYADKIEAQVLVQPIAHNPRYNPFSHVVEENTSEYPEYCPDPRYEDHLDSGQGYGAMRWAAAVHPYLVPWTHDIDLGANCTFFPTVPIRPTASKPLTGLQGFGHAKSGVFGHPKWHLECSAVLGSKYPKLQQTTGVVTWDNYSASKAGAKAKFHHMLGFTVVEVIDNKFFHMRRVVAESKSGAFFDTCGGRVYYTDSGKVTTHKGETAALMIGDSHAEESCPHAVDATLDQIKVLKPQRKLVNDILSASAQNKHDAGKPYLNYVKHLQQDDRVQRGLQQAYDLLLQLDATDVLASNHHDHLDQWCDDPRGHFDPVNADVWHMLNYLKREHLVPAFQAWCAQQSVQLDGVKWHQRSGSCVIDNVAFVHGHDGVDGAKGLRARGDRVGRKTVSAHTHTPFGLGGYDVVGHTSQPQHGYNNAQMSSWLQGNLVLYPNGKRQHLHIIRDCAGYWRTDK